jgi:hypothetical protein
MLKIAVATIVLLCLATATGCWLIYGIEHQRQEREMREAQVRELAELESENYQAWQHGMRYEIFADSLRQSKAWPKPSDAHDRDVWIKSFEKSDVRCVGKSRRFGYASYEVNSTIGLHDRPVKSFREFIIKHTTTYGLSALAGHWYHCAVHCRVEKMAGPDDWITSDWQFSPITYNGDFPFKLLKRSLFTSLVDSDE